MAETLDPTAFAGSLLRGQHGGFRPTDVDSGVPPLEQIHKQGREIVFVCDDRQLVEEWSDEFDTVFEIEHAPTSNAGSWEESAMFTTFATALEVLDRATKPTLLWLHSSALNQSWDAPFEWRAALHDEDDPEPLEGIEPVHRTLDPDTDPDELFPVTMAYAAQIRLLDECLGLFLDSLESKEAWRSADFVLTSIRGYPIGEHGSIGAANERLFGESLRIPLIVRSQAQTQATRHLHMIQPSALHSLFIPKADATPSKLEENQDTAKSIDPLSLGLLERPRMDIAVSATQEQSAIRTPAWFLTRNSNIADTRLYAKPDDLWEVSDVLDRCPEVANELTDLLDRIQKELIERNDWSRIPTPASHLIQSFP